MRRYTSILFDRPVELEVSGDDPLDPFGASGTLSGELHVGVEDALNPYRHRYGASLPLNVGGFKASNRINGLSPNGAFVTGGSTSASGREGFVFPPPGEVCLVIPPCTPLAMGDLPGGAFFSEAMAISNFGVAVGFGTSASGREAFRAFLESNIVQELLDVPAFRQLASFDSGRDSGPALVLTFPTEVAGHTLFGKRRRTVFGAPANFDTCSNPKLFEFAVLLEGIDNPDALGGRRAVARVRGAAGL
jgi:hypothetical protein